MTTIEEEFAIITGFEPFGPYETNPSWECVKTLEPKIETPGRDITLHIKEVPVEYSPILNIIPTLHEAKFPTNVVKDGDDRPSKPYKYFFHVGVGSPGGVVVETIGRRTGYTKPDNQDFVVPEGKVTGYDDHPDIYRTRVDVPALVEHVRAKTGYEDVRVGTDMGLYLCEFIFYVSSAESQTAQQDSIVLFVHLPPLNDPYSIQQDREIVLAIIDWVVTHH